jgi:hypothetical protein
MKQIKELYRRYNNFFPADLWAFLIMTLVILFGVFIL